MLPGFFGVSAASFHWLGVLTSLYIVASGNDAALTPKKPGSIHRTTSAGASCDTAERKRGLSRSSSLAAGGEGVDVSSLERGVYIARGTTASGPVQIKFAK